MCGGRGGETRGRFGGSARVLPERVTAGEVIKSAGRRACFQFLPGRGMPASERESAEHSGRAL